MSASPRRAAWAMLACALLFCLSVAAPASAHDFDPSDQTADPDWPPPDDGGYWEEDGEDWPTYDEPATEPTVEPVPTPEPPVYDAPVYDPPVYEPPVPQLPLVTTPTVAGKVAQLRTNGKAAIPRGAPQRVRAIIAAANRIVGKPYKWGGGHALLEDRGYDCSGSVSYALIRAGQLTAPLVSGSFARWGESGEGRWVTIYANKSHVYMEVAGLRLDTSTAGDWGGKSGVRWRVPIGGRPRFKVRHPAGL